MNTVSTVATTGKMSGTGGTGGTSGTSGTSAARPGSAAGALLRPRPSPPAEAPVHFLPGAVLDDAARDRMAALLFSTSYLEYCSAGNKLRLPLRALQRLQNIDPYIAHVYAMVECGGGMAGFFTAATVGEFNAVQAVSHYREEVRAMDAAYDAFIARNTREDDFLVGSLAIEGRCQGRGWFAHMLAEIERLARARGCPRIVLTVWESSAAMPLYLRRGFRRCDSFGYAYELFFDRLHFLDYPLRGD
ncbi:hypothetical protein ASC94_05570 [Massilia sp. Root418]|nr:hypothetical protein ASC94_05570 [Massilia sp. Root418]